jgi:protein TonB
MPLRRRVSGIALALGVNLLLLLIMLGIGAMRSVPPIKSSGSLVVDLLPQSTSAASRPRTAAPKPRTTALPVPPRPPQVLPVKPSLQPERPLDMIEMSKEDLAASDIGKFPKAGAGAGSGAAGDSEEVGRGPNGEILYAAEWARKPTDAELGGYLPANAPDGWGLVACRTIPGNRVDDCIELENSPRGSRLASAVRQAAWQFRVRPPRKNGRAMVGEWVQIRITYSHTRSE